MKNMEIFPAGDCALVVEFGNRIEEEINDKVHALSAYLKKREVKGIREMLPAFRSLMVFYDSSETDFFKLSKIIRHYKPSAERHCKKIKRKLIVPCCYGGEYGPDLNNMSALTGIGQKEIIRIHGETDYKIYMLGFLPGFVYLGGLNEKIAVPRLDTPRIKIPARSVGIGGNQTGVYPIFADDKSDATEAISAYNNCSSHDISAVIGSCSSSCTLSFVETAQNDGMLVITPYSTNATICKTGDYIFRECFSDADQGPTLARLATEEFGAVNIAVIAAEDSDYCAGLAEAMEGALDEMEGVSYQHYGCVTTDTDYTAQISKAIEQGAEVLIYPNNYDTVPNFVKQARDAGFEGPILGGDAWDGTDVTGYESKFDNCYYLAHLDLSADTQAVQSYVSAYKEAYGEDGLNAVSSLYYDSVKMLVKAMEEANSYDPEVVKDTLLGIEYESMGGTITYDENGDAVKPFTIETFKDGVLTYYGSF